MAAPANPSPKAEHSLIIPGPANPLTTRRALIRSGVAAGVLATALYAIPTLTSVGPKKAFAHTPVPNVDDEAECIGTAITFLHGHHGVAATHNGVIGTSYPLPTAGTGVKFVNWRFKDDPPGDESLGFSDNHGAVTDDSCDNPQTGVVLFPSGPSCIDLKLRIGIPASTLVTAKIIGYSAANPSVDCEPLEDDATEDSAEVPFAVEALPRVESLTFPLTSFGPYYAVSITLSGTTVWGLDTVSFGTT